MVQRTILENKRKALRQLIREVGEAWGEDPVFLNGYILDQIIMWSNTDVEIGRITACFQDLKRQKK